MGRKRKDGSIRPSIRVPTQSDLHELLNYDKDTGIFTWLKKRGGTISAGTKAGSRHQQGYVQVGVLGRNYLAHRLAWIYVYGEWPENEVDHIDGNRLNNAISNLRKCTHTENHQNVTKRGHNTSGYVGVSRHECGYWVARIVSNKVRINLGSFVNKEDAAQAYLDAKKQVHTFQPTPRVEK